MAYRRRWMRHGWIRKPLVAALWWVYLLMYVPEWIVLAVDAMRTDWNGETGKDT